MMDCLGQWVWQATFAVSDVLFQLISLFLEFVINWEDFKIVFLHFNALHGNV